MLNYTLGLAVCHLHLPKWKGNECFNEEKVIRQEPTGAATTGTEATTQHTHMRAEEEVLAQPAGSLFAISDVEKGRVFSTHAGKLSKWKRFSFSLPMDSQLWCKSAKTNSCTVTFTGTD